jgi:centromere/kinetochore protein ZW10
VSFRYSEIAYNENLMQVVEQLQDISALLESAQDAAVHSRTLHALERLEDADGAFKRLGPFEHIRVVGLLKARSGELRSAIVENVTESWNGLIMVDAGKKRVTLKEEIEQEATIHIDTIVDALTKLNLLDNFVARLARDLDAAIISPRLSISAEQIASALEIEGDEAKVVGAVSDMSVRAALEDIQAISEYLSTRLPPSVAVPLSEKLLPVLASRLINKWLLPAVPLSTDGVLEFQDTLSLVLGLVEFFDELGWSGQNRLTDWVDKSAEIWLARQKEVAIGQLRRIFPKQVQQKKTVERVETQILSKGDAMLGGQEEHDEDWGADWGEEDPAPEEAKLRTEEVEEEDVSAWGMDEDEPQEEHKASEINKPEQAEDDAEDWGADWGDDDNAKPIEPEPEPAPKPQPTTDAKANGKASTSQKASTNRELTLRETYTVTAIPDAIMDLILEVVTDVETLNTPSLVGSAIAPASGGLYATPGLLLTMYRATAAAHYSKHDAANMLIYNDCTRLSDRLTLFLTSQLASEPTSPLPPHLRPSTRLKASLEQNIKAIDGFGKRAYGREMELQRTILRDHLDAAQGFTSCTAMPFAAECDNAIMMTLDRIKHVQNSWSPILSPSALHQSLGSLVSTVLAKYMTDVEDMPDIAQDESQKLHGYCKSLSTLSELFQEVGEGGEVRDMVSLYTPNWFKFQYFSEILDGSLADIRFFWTDGGLRLEMGSEEVVDLVRALFAESEHRRKTIAVIRRGSRQ